MKQAIKHRIFSMLLCLCMVVSVVPTAALAEDAPQEGEIGYEFRVLLNEEQYTGIPTDGTAYLSCQIIQPADGDIAGKVQLGNGSDATIPTGLTDLTIPDTVQDAEGKLYTVSAVAAYAFKTGNTLLSLNLPKNMDSIGEYAFKGCSSLLELTIPEGVTLLSYESVYNCSALKILTLPSTLRKMDKASIGYCSNLLSVVIDNETCTPEDNLVFNSMAVYECSKLNSIVFTNAETAPVFTNIFAMYHVAQECTLYVPQGSEALYQAAVDGTSLKIETAGLVGDVFEQNGITYKISSATAVQVGDGINPAADLSQPVVVIPIFVKNGGIIYTVNTIAANAFADYMGTLKFSSGTRSAISFDSNAFGSSTAVHMSVPVGNSDLYENAGSAYNELAADKIEFFIDEYFEQGCVFIVDDITYLITQMPSEDNAGTVQVGNGSNAVIDSSTSVTIPSSVSYTDTNTSVEYSFAVTKLGKSAFENCSELNSVLLPNSISKIEERAFYNCSSITTLTIPEGVEKIGDLAFNSCTAMKEISLPQSLTQVGTHIFAGCMQLENIVLPDDLQALSNYMFLACKSLKSVTIGANTTTMQNGCFANCTALAAVTIPEGVTTIGNASFESNTQLKKVNIPSTVTTIGSSAFSGCSSLESIVLPASVQKIQNNVFAGAAELKLITFEGATPPSFDVSVFTETNEALKLYVPMGSKDAYTTALQINNPEMGEDRIVEYPVFADVASDAYYCDAVRWAAMDGITNGKTAELFAPEDNCTRGQIVTFLWRANGMPEPESTENTFTDVSSDEYYAKAVQWAVESGITKGTTDTTFTPDSPCTRAQAVTFQWRANGEPDTANISNPFTDVVTGEYYENAVLWAVNEGITNGTTETTFTPDGVCKRCEIVTFLYRDVYTA